LLKGRHAGEEKLIWNHSSIAHAPASIQLSSSAFSHNGLMTLAMKREETRQKLIESAGQIFAELGYDAATVRQITDRAGANIASVNYHFGDKLQLYREVLTKVLSQRRQWLELSLSLIST